MNNGARSVVWTLIEFGRPWGVNSRMKRIKFFLLYLLGKPRWDTGIVPPEVVEFVEQHPPRRALDIGCGTGTNLLYLMQKGWQGSGVDFSWLAVFKARQRLRKAGFPPNVWVDDATRLTKAKGEYNYILDIGCFHQLSPAGKRAAMDSILKILALDGCWMLYGHCWNPSESMDHGLSEQDISEVSSRFRMIRRVDGQEGTRGPSVWLWLERRGL